VLGPKRVLPVFGLRPASRAEWDLFPVPEGQRAAVFDEALTVVRALLDADEASFSGRFFQIDNVSLGIPVPSRVDLWLGGSAPRSNRTTTV
jgi:alkanesulfonate monooxygenase SsuD/methylene tetrahydromethanopterin reductase-like flavin-dependent oxidoreductase (luciferase family)